MDCVVSTSFCRYNKYSKIRSAIYWTYYIGTWKKERTVCATYFVKIQTSKLFFSSKNVVFLSQCKFIYSYSRLKVSGEKARIVFKDIIIYMSRRCAILQFSLYKLHAFSTYLKYILTSEKLSIVCVKPFALNLNFHL